MPLFLVLGQAEAGELSGLGGTPRQPEHVPGPPQCSGQHPATRRASTARRMSAMQVPSPQSSATKVVA